MDKCLQTTPISKVFVLQGRGCAQIAGNFKGFPKLINFLFFELFEIEKMGFEWQCVFIEPSGTLPMRLCLGYLDLLKLMFKLVFRKICCCLVKRF